MRLKKQNSPLRGRMLEDTDLFALARLCHADQSAAGLRDLALFAVGAGCGLRRAEIAALRVGNWHADKGMLIIEHGKGDVERQAYLPPKAGQALERWLSLRGPLAADAALFTPVNKSGKITERGLTSQAI